MFTLLQYKAYVKWSEVFYVVLLDKTRRKLHVSTSFIEQLNYPSITKEVE